MSCTAENGCDEFWAFVDKIDWISRPSFPSLKQLMRAEFSAEQIVHFNDEYDRLTRRVSETIENNLDLDYGGGDDHTFMDLPGEVVGRGKNFFESHVDDPASLSSFGDAGGIRECFAYIFHPFRDGVADDDDDEDDDEGSQSESEDDE